MAIISIFIHAHPLPALNAHFGVSNIDNNNMLNQIYINYEGMLITSINTCAISKLIVGINH